ncbi:MAG TPA: TetR family transcriptional regulator [Campylobacterales bacterium]|nr:TetR family transcriptional regulator [Campylobacterales bacterium]
MKKELRGRPKTFDETEALTAAMYYFWDYGYDNTSLDNLLEAMKIKKSSFYATFKSKEEIFSRTLTLYQEFLEETLMQMKKEIGPKATLLAIPRFSIQELQETGKIRGCLLVNSSRECYTTYKELEAQINLQFNQMDTIFSALVTEAKELGEITNTREATKLKNLYLNTINGLIISIQSGANQETIDDIFESIDELLI